MCQLRGRIRWVKPVGSSRFVQTVQWLRSPGTAASFQRFRKKFQWFQKKRFVSRAISELAT